MLKSVLNVELLCHIDSSLHKYECDPIIHWTAHRGGGEMRLAIVTKRQIGFQFTIRECNHCRTDSSYADRINCTFAMCWGPRASRSARLILVTRWIRNSDGRIRTAVMTRRKIRSPSSNRTPTHEPLPALCWISYLNTVTAFLYFIFQQFTSKHELCHLLTQVIFFPCGCDCITGRQLILFWLLLRSEVFCYNSHSCPGCGWLIVRDCGLRLCFLFIYPHSTAAKLNGLLHCQRHNMWPLKRKRRCRTFW